MGCSAQSFAKSWGSGESSKEDTETLLADSWRGGWERGLPIPWESIPRAAFAGDLLRGCCNEMSNAARAATASIALPLTPTTSPMLTYPSSPACDLYLVSITGAQRSQQHPASTEESFSFECRGIPARFGSPHPGSCCGDGSRGDVSACSLVSLRLDELGAACSYLFWAFWPWEGSTARLGGSRGGRVAAGTV